MIDARNLPMDVRVAISNSSNVALEMADVDGIKSYLEKRELVLYTFRSVRRSKS